jgi:transcriptional regulator with XRE-family HTH domain/tetratricopeptide (TPR) repeat protein
VFGRAGVFVVTFSSDDGKRGQGNMTEHQRRCITTGQSGVKKVREGLLVLGLSVEQIAGVFVLHHKLRPRAAYRHALGWTQEEAAERICGELPDSEGRDQSLVSTHVSRYEAWPDGGRKPPEHHLRAMAQAYGTSVADLLDSRDREKLGDQEIQRLVADVPVRSRRGSASAPQHVRTPLESGRQGTWPAPATRPPVRSGAGGPVAEAAVSATLNVFEEWDVLMERRTLLAAGGASAILTPGFLGPLAQGTTVAPETLNAWTQITDSYRRLDNLAGSTAVIEQAREHHRQLSVWMRTVTAADRSRVALLVADSGALMGWLSTDLEQYPQAGAYYRQSAAAAREAGTEGLYAYAVSRWSRVLAECAAYGDALRFADTSVAASSRAHPVVRAWAVVTRAYAHAGLRDERSCRRDLQLAERLLDKAHAYGEPPPACVRFFDTTHLQKWSGYALMELGSTRLTSAARRALDTAADRWSGSMVRGAAEVDAACATARIAHGEIAEAVEFTRRAYDVAARTRSPRNLRRVAEVRARLLPHRRVREVRELDEYLLTGSDSASG